MNSRKILVGIVGIALLLAGCGSAQPAAEEQATEAPPDEAEVIEMRVGIMPFADSVGPFVAQQEGYFEEEGLDVELVTFQSGSDAVSAVISQDLAVTYTGTIPQLNAMAQGAPIIFVANHSEAHTEPPDGHAILAMEDSGIEGVQDLAGKRIAANQIGSVVWLTGLEWMDMNGVDTDTVEWAEVPFPQMNDVLSQGEVDAIAQLEPFTTIMQESGGVALGYPYVEVQPGLTVAAFISHEAYVEENPEAVDRFTRALQKAFQVLETDEEKFRQHIVDYTGMGPELASSIVLQEQHAYPINVDALQTTVDLLVKWGAMDESFQVSDFVYKSAMGEFD